MLKKEKLIIQECLKGNQQEFEILIKKYQPNVIALALNILGDPDEALDAAQDTFAQAYLNLHRFDLDRNFKNWLMGIAVKRSLDRIKKRKSFLEFFNQYSKNMELSKTYKSYTTYSIEESPIFRQCIKKLSPKERTALSLKINEGYKAKEIGEILNCSENTAFVYLFKAKQKIKRALAAENLGSREVNPCE